MGRSRQRGFSLVELMVAMTLGVLLIAGAVQLLVRSQQAYRVNENVARLQETARHALALLELDVRMAGYWGLSNRAERILNRATPAEALPADLASAAAGIHACGRNWAIHMSQPVAASNGRYGLECPAYNRRSQPDSDLLLIRRLDGADPTPPDTPRLRVIANAAEGRLVIAPCTDSRNSACSRSPPLPPSPPGARTHDLVVHAYYLSRDATGVAGQPSLRRKRLVGGAGGAAIQDEEIIAGVEDFQLQIGTAEPGAATGVRFQDPDQIDFNDPERPVVAVRLWLLVRSDAREIGFVDAEEREFPPGRRLIAPRDDLRRLLVTTTIELRNTRP